MLKARLDMLQRVFARFSGKDDKPSAPYRTMSFAEYNMLVERAGFVDSEAPRARALSSLSRERETKMRARVLPQGAPDADRRDGDRRAPQDAVCRVRRGALPRRRHEGPCANTRAEVPPFAEAAKKTAGAGAAPGAAGGEMSPAERLYVVLEAHVKYVLSPDGRKPERVVAIEPPRSPTTPRPAAPTRRARVAQRAQLARADPARVAAADGAAHVRPQHHGDAARVGRPRARRARAGRRAETPSPTRPRAAAHGSGGGSSEEDSAGHAPPIAA